RSLPAKLRQILRALEIERALSKDEILTLYLSLAPYGGNLEGVRAASLAYLGKEPRRLTLGEAAMLIALPQSPERRRPDPTGRAARWARRAIACSSAPPPPASFLWMRSSAPSMSRYLTHAGRCRYWRRMRRMRRLPPRPTGSFIA